MCVCVCACACVCAGVGLKTYMRVPDPADPSAPPAIVRYDPVLQLLENTLSSPVDVDRTLEPDRDVVECPSVPRTFLNAVCEDGQLSDSLYFID